MECSDLREGKILGEKRFQYGVMKCSKVYFGDGVQIFDFIKNTESILQVGALYVICIY